MAKKNFSNSVDRFGNNIDNYNVVEDRHQYGDIRMDEYQYEMFDSIVKTESSIHFVEAPAGSGKTTIAFAAGCYLYHTGKIGGVIYIVSPYAEQRQGFLPGDQTKKSEVYFEPAWQALLECGEDPESVIADEAMAKQGINKYDNKWVTLCTCSYLRGSNIKNKLVIIDEAQNYTEADLRTVVSRIHDDCRVIIAGNVRQCDLSSVSKSGMMKCLNHYMINYPENSRLHELVYNYRGWISCGADEDWGEKPVYFPCTKVATPRRLES